MLLAALSFSVMSGFAKVLRHSFNAPQLVFYRNLIGLVVLPLSVWKYPLQQTGGRPGLLIFRGFMGTMALYTLMYCIIHMPLGAAMTYNTLNTFYIAGLSYFIWKEKLHSISWICILLGFAGVLLIYKPNADFSWGYHAVGLLHGLFSAFAYLSIGKLNKYYDSRVIVLSFLSSGLILPIVMMLIAFVFQLPHDDFFFPDFILPSGNSWWQLLGMGITALLGQYYVTKAYSNDKAGIIAAIGYSNILFAVIIGVILGDAIPDVWMLGGILMVVMSGVVISLTKGSEGPS